jgi:hypothetical protein
MGMTVHEQVAGVALGVIRPSECPELAMAQRRLDLPLPDPIDAAVTVVHACARLVANDELTPREGAAMVVKVDREVSHLAPGRPVSRGGLGIGEIVDLYYLCDMDCDHLDDAARLAIEAEIREAFRDLARPTAN